MAQLIFGRDIASGTVDTVNLTDGSVTTAKLAAGAVGSSALASGAVTSSALAAGSVTSSALAAGAVSASNIGASTITAAQIASGTIVAGNMAANSIVAASIASGAVTSSKLASSSVTSSAIAAGAVTTAALADGSVTTAKLADGSVTTAKYAAGSINNAALSTGELHFAADTTSLINKKIVFNLQLDNLTFSSGPSADVSSALSLETSVTSAGSTEGVITDQPKNKVNMVDINFAPILDGSNRTVYGLLSFSSGVWTLTYFVDISGTRTAYSLPSPLTSAHAMVAKRFNLNVAPEDSFRNAAQYTNNTSALASHITQATGAHAASAISILDSAAHFTTKNVEYALAAIVGASWVDGTSDTLNGHLNKGTAAHNASAVRFVPDNGQVSPLTSIQVNAAIEELHTQVEALQANPVAALFGFKYFTASSGQTAFVVTGGTNAPFVQGNHSLMVFVDGIIQSIDAGHYTEDPSGTFFTLSTGATLNSVVLALWHK